MPITLTYQPSSRWKANWYGQDGSRAMECTSFETISDCACSIKNSDLTVLNTTQQVILGRETNKNSLLQWKIVFLDDINASHKDEFKNSRPPYLFAIWNYISSHIIQHVVKLFIRYISKVKSISPTIENINWWQTTISYRSSLVKNAVSTFRKIIAMDSEKKVTFYQ